MGKLISFDILFARNPPVYSSGESVSGTVIVHLRDDMRMRGIRVGIYGRAYSQVIVVKTRSVSDGNGGTTFETYTETYVAYETYLNNRVTLWGKEVGDRSGPNPILSAGKYEFNFNFKLPTNTLMPSSFEGGYRCNIRYMIKANIDKPWKFDHVAKRAFTFLESIDVNDRSLLRQPCPLENEKFLCCFCCKSGPLKLTGWIDRCGYCPGEGILINAECENLTNRKMTCVRARLNRFIMWFAGGYSEIANHRVFEIRSPGQIDQGESFSWKNELVTLPSISPSIRSCGIISVRYDLEITVVVPRGINLRISFPITIGTIPLRKHYSPVETKTQLLADTAPTANQGSDPGGPSMPEAAGSSPDANLPTSPSPTYQACVDGASDIKDADESDYLMGEREFAPMYLFVSNYQPPSRGTIPSGNQIDSDQKP